jgi:sigma-54 dependent transcriptional regulator, acetoin dehydrogenase operon transcriptional activator AcoR
VVVEVLRSTSTLRLATGPVEVPAAPGPVHHTSGPPALDRPFTGLAGTSRSWRSSCAAVRAAAHAARSTVVLGETGTGKSALVRAAHHEVRSGARRVMVDGDAADAADTLAGLPAEIGAVPATVVVRRLGALDTAGAEALAELLVGAPATWWVVGLVTGETVPPDDPAHTVLGDFAGSVTVDPLRRRPDDIPQLIGALLARLAPSRRVRCTPEATALLAGGLWPANATQLGDVLRRALAVRPAGDIEAGDLPGEFAVHGTRRRLSPLEAAERDLIVNALIEARGNRVRAAAALGMGRATLYRRLRAFGIGDVGR